MASMPSAAAVAIRRTQDPIADRASAPRPRGTVAALARLARSGAGILLATIAAAAAVAAAIGGGGGSGATTDGSAGGGHGEPGGAEGIHALAVVLAGPAVAGEVVQRVLVVGDLGGAVTTLDGAHQRRLHVAARLGGAAALVDRPGGHTSAGAGRLVRL